MPISSTQRKVGPTPGNGTSRDFPFTFKVFDVSEVDVIRTSASGGDVALTQPTDYVVTLNPDQNAQPGGTVRLSTALGVGLSLTILSAVPITQLSNWQSQGGFNPDDLDDDLDRQTAVSQQLAERLGRTLVVPATVADEPIQMAKPVGDALLAWSADGTRVVNIDPKALASHAAYSSSEFDVFTGDGVETVFNLSLDGGSLANLRVSIAGVAQTPGEDFFWNGGTEVEFAEPPADGLKIVIQYFAVMASSAELNDAAARAEAAATEAEAAATEAEAAAAAAAAALGTKADTSLANIDLPAAVASLRLADFATRTAAQAAFILAPQSYIRTAGYTTAGDGGGALYTRAASGQLKTADGQWWEIAQSSVTPEMFGAKGNGTTDDTAAINAAIAHPRAREVVLQDKSYKVTTVNFSRTITLRGLNKWSSALVGSTTNTPVITITAAPMDIRNLRIDRSVVPVVGATGITTLNGGFGKLSDLVVQNQYDGIFLQSTANSEISNIISQFNYRFGIRGEVTSTGAEPALQWKMTNIISQMNESYGFWFYAFGSTNLQTGFVAINCGTFRNGVGGWKMTGDPGTAWNDVNMYHCYSSFDNGHGIDWSNCGANNQMFDTFCEWNAMVGGGRGFDNIPARRNGCGMVISQPSPSGSSLTISGLVVQNSAMDGVFVDPTATLRTLQLIGAVLRDNGQANVNFRKSGFADASTTTNVYLSNIVCRRENYTTQEYGISTDSLTVAAKVLVWGGDFRNNLNPSQNPASSYGAWIAVPATF